MTDTKERDELHRKAQRFLRCADCDGYRAACSNCLNLAAAIGDASDYHAAELQRVRGEALQEAIGVIRDVLPGHSTAIERLRALAGQPAPDARSQLAAEARAAIERVLRKANIDIAYVRARGPLGGVEAEALLAVLNILGATPNTETSERDGEKP